MGYTKSKRVIQRVEVFLDFLLRHDETVTWAAVDGHRLGRWIHQGIFASKFHSDYKKYSTLLEKYKICKHDDRVVAEYVRAQMEILATSQAAVTLEEPSNTLEIIGAVIQLKAHKLYFPNGEATRELYAWCAMNHYWIIENEEGITLTKEDVGELAWTPQSVGSN